MERRTHMLLSRASMNQMPYSLYKKLWGLDEELIKTSVMINGVRGERMLVKGVASTELTIGRKTLDTIFFSVYVQGIYNVLLGHNWIHANGCVPSSLHQFLVQWVGDQNWGSSCRHISLYCYAQCSVAQGLASMSFLIGIDLADFAYISCTKEGFVRVSLKPIGNLLKVIIIIYM